MFHQIHDSDTVIVYSQSDAESGEIVIVIVIVIVMVNGDETVYKKLVKYKDGIALVSINPAYEPLHLSNKEKKPPRQSCGQGHRVPEQVLKALIEH